jgi:hypothetical protein
VNLYNTPVSVLIVYTLNKILALRSRHVHPTAAVTFDSHRLIMILHNPEDYCTFTQCTVGGFETAGNSCVVSSSTCLSFSELLWLLLLAQDEMSPLDFCVN